MVYHAGGRRHCGRGRDLRSGPVPTGALVQWVVVGNAMLDTQESVREVVPAEDRMQAFLWRHLVPASDL